MVSDVVIANLDMFGFRMLCGIQYRSDSRLVVTEDFDRSPLDFQIITDKGYPQSVSQPSDAATNSNSIVDFATVSCFLDLQLTS
jgi:hypothetical protein